MQSARGSIIDRLAAANAVLLVTPVIFIFVLFYAFLNYINAPTVLTFYSTSFGILASAATVVVAFSAAKRVEQKYQLGFVLIGSASVFMICTDFFWAVLHDIYPAKIEFNEYLSLLYQVPYLGWTLIWVSYWAILLFTAGRTRSRPQVQFVFAAVLSVIAVVLFLGHYLPFLLTKNPSNIQGFVLLYACTELVAFVLCIMVAVKRTYHFPAILASGFLTIVAVDFLYNTSDLMGTMVPNFWAGWLWVVGEILLLGGALKAYHMVASIDEDAIAEAHTAVRYSHGLVALGVFAFCIGIFVIGLRTILPTPELRVALSLYAVGLLAIVSNRLSLEHGIVVARAFRQVDPHKNDNIILRLFGSYSMVQALRDEIRSNRDSCIKVGDEFLFSTEPTHENINERTAFLAMPYDMPWSSRLFNEVKRVNEFCGWNIRRADEQFSSHQLLKNLWVEICAADVFIADITSLNPNVMYEIGIAHALGKSVILLAQDGLKIPFDLTVQRIIFYDINSEELDLGERIANVLSHRHSGGRLAPQPVLSGETARTDASPAASVAIFNQSVGSPDRATEVEFKNDKSVV